MPGPQQTMDPSDARMELGRLVAERHLELEALTPRQGMAVSLGFYQTVRARGCDLEADADMLLFQWGTHDWGEGEHFEVSVVRQFLVPQGEEDPDILQLSLTFRFPATDLLRGFGSGNRWCDSPSRLDEMRTFIEASPAFAAVADRGDGSASLWMESVE